MAEARFSVSRALVFYAVLLGGALLWGGLRGDLNVFVLVRESGEPRPPLPMNVAWGVGVGLFFVLASRLVSRFAWSKRLTREFRRLIGPLTLWQVTLLAISSSIAEEALFRGAMQPSWGVVATSLVFGVLHVGPGRAFLPWTLSALASGFALGYVTEHTGDLLAATLAHFTVNYFNLSQIARAEPTSG
jgi:hypothetical protein